MFLAITTFYDQLDQALSQLHWIEHGQRFGQLFNQCHDVVWSMLETQGNQDQLLRLFKHSSFVWRLKGEEKLETKYALRMAKLAVSEATEITTPKSEKSYFIIRLKRLTDLIKAATAREIPPPPPQ